MGGFLGFGPRGVLAIFRCLAGATFTEYYHHEVNAVRCVLNNTSPWSYFNVPRAE